MDVRESVGELHLARQRWPVSKLDDQQQDGYIFIYTTEGRDCGRFLFAYSE